MLESAPSESIGPFHRPETRFHQLTLRRSADWSTCAKQNVRHLFSHINLDPNKSDLPSRPISKHTEAVSLPARQHVFSVDPMFRVEPVGFHCCTVCSSLAVKSCVWIPRFVCLIAASCRQFWTSYRFYLFSCPVRSGPPRPESFDCGIYRLKVQNSTEFQRRCLFSLNSMEANLFFSDKHCRFLRKLIIQSFKEQLKRVPGL